jgi:hypothetical protein
VSDPFEIGRTYARRAISEELGGNPQSALPHSNGKVLCACLKPENNPDAPRCQSTLGEEDEEFSGRDASAQ